MAKAVAGSTAAVLGASTKEERYSFKAVRMLKEGTCSVEYLNEIKSLSETMQLASKCGLGQSSPNAFLSILEHFKHEIFGRVPV